MTLQLLHSEFPYIWGKFDFLFYQCSSYYFASKKTSQLKRAIRKIERNVGPSYVFADSYGIWSGVPLPAGLQTNNSLKRLGHEIEYQYTYKKEYFVV